MVNKEYHTPNVDRIYTVDDIAFMKKSTDKGDIWKVINLINNAREDEICRVFSDGIDQDIKKRMDVMDLRCIEDDIKRYNTHNGSVDSLHSNTLWHLVIDTFLSLKEDKFEKTLNYNDILKIEEICSTIKILKPNKQYRKRITNEQKFIDIGVGNIISAIRNGLMHNRYIINGMNVYIHSEKAWTTKTNQKDINGEFITEEKDFEAVIPLEFFDAITKFCLSAERKSDLCVLKMNNINRKKGFDYNKNNIQIARTKGKKGDLYWRQEKSLYEISYDLINNNERSFHALSKKQKEFLSKYFETHAFNEENLNFVHAFMDDRYDNRISLLSWTIEGEEAFEYAINQRKKYLLAGNNELCNDIIESFTKGKVDKRKIWEKNDLDIKTELEERFKKSKVDLFDCDNIKVKASGLADKVLNSTRKNLIIQNSQRIKDELLLLKDVFSSRLEYRKLHLKTLYLSKFYVNNPKLELSAPQPRKGKQQRMQGCNYIMDKCKNKPKLYRSNEVKKSGIDKVLGDYYRTYLFKQFTRGDVEDWIIKRDNDEIEDYINDNRDYVMFNTPNAKKLSPDQRQIVEENVRKVIKEWKEKLDTVTLIGEEEHIRNAFAHNHYTIIPGFNKILLRDPSIDDTPNWEEIYDLDELYQNAVSRVYEDYLDMNVAA